MEWADGRPREENERLMLCFFLLQALGVVRKDKGFTVITKKTSAPTKPKEAFIKHEHSGSRPARRYVCNQVQHSSKAAAILTLNPVPTRLSPTRPPRTATVPTSARPLSSVSLPSSSPSALSSLSLSPSCAARRLAKPLPLRKDGEHAG